MGIKLACSILLILVSTVVSFAQSVDVGSPTPVRSNTVSGNIAARDLGDSRLTDHYFAFTGTPGDLLITIQSTNLNGDLDVFTAVTLRPLLKLSLYAESTTPVTKGIYLRKREDLILRIEARSPNDDPGTYRLYFGGSFEPLPGGPDIAEAAAEPSPEPAATGQKGRRVSSVGARIEEPAPPVTEVAAAPTPAPTPEPTPEAKPVETPKPAVTEKSTAETGTAKTTPPLRNTRGRRPAPRTQAPPPKERPPTDEPAPSVRAEETKRATEEPKPKPPAPEPEPEVGPRLIIETNDGTLINRSMSTIKRVTIENGMIVVTGKDGKISRMLLINVVRMQIQP
jgi:hypothetical protein